MAVLLSHQWRLVIQCPNSSLPFSPPLERKLVSLLTSFYPTSEFECVLVRVGHALSDADRTVFQFPALLSGVVVWQCTSLLSALLSGVVVWRCACALLASFTFVALLSGVVVWQCTSLLSALLSGVVVRRCHCGSGAVVPPRGGDDAHSVRNGVCMCTHFPDPEA